MMTVIEQIITDPNAWVAFLTLTFLEIVLGIDNIIFISIVTGKLPAEQQKRATKIGMFLAMFMRIILLFGISILIGLKEPWIQFDWGWAKADITGQSFILLLGGLFLLYKSTKEIRHKVDERGAEEKSLKEAAVASFGSVLFQIIMIDLVFSFDSILTAVGMTNGIVGSLFIMIAAVIISVLVMMQFAMPVSKFVNKHPSIQILALAFLILIGFMLITEAAHLSHASMFESHVTPIPKGYLYFAICFSLIVEMLNLKMFKNKGNKRA
jgi:predicted tellurium resistance membrane protein TerC